MHEIAARTQSDVVDVDEMIAQAKAEAEKKGEKFTKEGRSRYPCEGKSCCKAGRFFSLKIRA